MLLRKKNHTVDDTKNTESLSKTSIKRSNLYIFIASGVCIALFSSAVLLNKGKKVDIPNTDIKVDVNQNSNLNNNLIADIPPDIDLYPTNIQMNNIDINSSSESVINIIVKDAPAVISKAELSTVVPSIQLTNTCTSREKMDVGEKCIITLSYNPVEVENKSLSLLVTWNPVGKNGVADQKNKNISVSISSKKAIVFSPPPEPVEEVIEEEFIEEYEEEEVAEEEYIPSTDRNDCRKYAAKGRTRSGDFLGWIQSNKKVLSPDCKRTLGTLQDDGKIVKVGTGEVIGMGPRLNNKSTAFEDRALQEIPEGLRDPIFDTTDAEEQFILHSEAMANRQAAKRGDIRTPKVDLIESARTGEEGVVDPYRASDPLNIMKHSKNELVPPSITDASQISSFPKKNKYTLRENKAIPAVLNRPVKFFDQKGGADGEAYGVQDVLNESDNCGNGGIRISATIERNVYADTGRTIVLPAGTLVLGCAESPVGDDKTRVFERVRMSWDRFVRPDGAEFNIGINSGGSEIQTFSGDSQGQDGVPGKRDVGYMKRMFLEPLMYSLLPMAINMISPSTQLIKESYNEGEGFLGNVTSNTYKNIITEGEISSKDQAKAEIIENWRTVTQEMMGNSLKNFQPPFTIPAGTRITIFVQKDLILRLTETKGEMTGIADDENM